jgi:hypothetical protein
MTIPIDALLASGKALLDKILEEEGIIDATRRVVVGFPGDRLADLADEEAAELIIVGARGRGAVKAACLGSVSTDVIGVARRPVLVVPSRANVRSRERVGATRTRACRRSAPVRAARNASRARAGSLRGVTNRVFSRPTRALIKRDFWRPDEPPLFVHKARGRGWTINFARIARRRGSR